MTADPVLFPAAPPTHTELVDRAVRWLRGFHKCAQVFGELTAGGQGYIPDAIGWRLGFSILVECKTSRSDFFADRKKLIHSLPDNYPGEERWYLTPPGLVRPEEVPTGWYLAETAGKAVRVVTHPACPPIVWHAAWGKEPDPARSPDRWPRERLPGRAAAGIPFLLSALRRHELRVPFDAVRGRFESFSEREARATGDAE